MRAGFIKDRDVKLPQGEIYSHSPILSLRELFPLSPKKIHSFLPHRPQVYTSGFLPSPDTRVPRNKANRGVAEKPANTFLSLTNSECSKIK